jgi:hypothetical protein
MSISAVIGCIVLLFALSTTSYLVWWSCRTIAIIKEKKVGTVRDILQELKNER